MENFKKYFEKKLNEFLIMEETNYYPAKGLNSFIPINSVVDGSGSFIMWPKGGSKIEKQQYKKNDSLSNIMNKTKNDLIKHNFYPEFAKIDSGFMEVKNFISYNYQFSDDYFIIQIRCLEDGKEWYIHTYDVNNYYRFYTNNENDLIEFIKKCRADNKLDRDNEYIKN